MDEKTPPPPSEPFGGSPPYQTPFPSASEEKDLRRSPGEAPAQARPRPPVRPGEVHDRLTIFVVRALFFFVAGGLGLYASRLDPFRLTIDPALSIVAACVLALVVIIGEAFFSKAPVRTLGAITFGLIIGLILAAVLQPVVQI